MKSKYEHFGLTGRGEYNEGLITGLLLGAAIGACTALLLSPKSGKAMRKKIKDLAGTQANTLDKHWEQAKDKAGQFADDSKDAIESAADHTRSKINDLTNKAESEMEDSAENIIDRFQKKY